MRNLILVLAAIIQVQSAYALSENAKLLMQFETKANGVSVRNSDPIQIQHYEIPLSVVKTLMSDASDMDAYKSLTFKKNGVDYVRWIINPEDTKWHKDVEKFLVSQGLDATKHKYFIGYMSASRSYMIEDPVTKHEFFAKVSTDKTGGNWKDKKQEWSDAADVKRAADHVNAALAKHTPQYFKYMDESLVMGLEKIDQGMVIRSVKNLSNSEFTYVPGFSAVHENTGRLIAKENGSDNPAEFWNEHYNKPLARAMAELLLMTGLSYDSPHSQNFLVELDAEMRPTGKIIFRDTGDVYVSSKYTAGMGSDFAKHWPSDNVRPDLSNVVGIMHGNTKPSWLSEETYKKWAVDYYREFDAHFSRMTGMSEKSIIAHSRSFGTVIDKQHNVGKSNDYVGRSLDIEGAEWQTFMKRIAAQKGYRGPVFETCGHALSAN